MKIFFTFIFCSIFIVSCAGTRQHKIALSKGIGSVNYEMYGQWVSRADNDAEIINLYGLTVAEALEKLNECDGLVLTGGPDVHPAYYNKAFDTARCSIDNYRDTLEFALIKSAEKLKLPVMAICRGAQIVNVAYGGDLIVDIPEDTHSEISHQEQGTDSFHEINIFPNTEFASITEISSGIANSNHHQAVGKLADIFISTTTTKDGIIEAYEMKDKSKPFFMAVQWHPERLDSNSRLSKPLAIKFIEAVKEKFNGRVK